MTEHGRLRQMLSARADLTGEEATQLEAHLRSCSGCRTLAGEYARQDDFLQSLRLSEPAATLRPGVFRRIEAAPPSRSRRGRTWLAVAPALALVLAAGGLLGHAPSAGPTADGPARFGPAQTAPNQAANGSLSTVPGPAPTGAQTNPDRAAPQRAANKGTASIPGFTFTHSWTGSGRSSWLHIPGGIYSVEERNRPPGCVTWVALAGRNGYHAVQIDPNFVPHQPAFHKGGARWNGYSAHLVTGWYRIEGEAAPGCTWTARITT